MKKKTLRKLAVALPLSIATVIGVACAIGGTLFVKAIDALQRVTARRSRDYYLWVVAGGLLIACDPADADALFAALKPAVPSAQRVGTVQPYTGGARIYLK